ncbi:MAG TPA: cytochrome d ubiquinol oxidase subunit II [Ilumatobacter sp.]|nr:cytochrome d ubiquinol oxidase subunit II [Ilumatobacter sp.]
MMSPAVGVAAVMFAGVLLYAIFGGADFGSGVWDLTAGNARRGAPLRRLVDHAIGPVWEANHVWLIFVIVFLWSGFPGPYSALMRTMAIPFWLAGLGIVIRGAGFAYRKYAPSLRWAKLAGIAFAGSSLITPFFLGTVAGGVASGRVPADGRGGHFAPWINATSLLGGVLATVTCTLLAGVFLLAEASRLDDRELIEDLRRKTLIGAAAVGVVVLAGIPVLLVDAPTLVDGLLGRGLPLVVASAVAGTATIWLVWTRRLRWARVTAAIACGSVVAGWGFGQYPWVLVDSVTIEDGAGARSTMIALLIAAGVAAVLVVPPLAYLLRLADTNRFVEEHDNNHGTNDAGPVSATPAQTDDERRW